MPRKKTVIIRRAKKIPCRVVGCSFYGKPMLAKGLAGHLRKTHGMSTFQNNNLPACSVQSLTEYMKETRGDKSEFRAPKICLLCNNQELIYRRLDRHVLKEHGLKVHQYETRVTMQADKEIHQRNGECTHKPYPCRHTDPDFCPAQKELLSNIRETEGDIPVDPLGDPSIAYPKVRLFRLDQNAEDWLRVTRGVNSQIKGMRLSGRTNILWHVKKLFMSHQHEDAFDASIKPPVTTSTRGYGIFCKYTCQLCGHWHQVRTWATPSIRPLDMEASNASSC